MSPTGRSLLSLLLVAVLLVAVREVRPTAPPAGAAVAPGFPAPTAQSRTRGLTFEGVSAADQQAILASVGRARPEAQRLIAAVSGLTRVRVRALGPAEAGATTSSARGYDVQFDLAGVTATLGARGVDRLVLHEFGHVVDASLVPSELKASLDEGIPRGYGCDDGVSGSCATREERFAESFAKWAMDDIGVNLSLGYKVPPPALPLPAWGAPLAALAG